MSSIAVLLLFFAPRMASAAAPPAQFLKQGQYLKSGEYLVTPDHNFYAIMSASGHFEIHKGSGPKDNIGLIWQTDRDPKQYGDYYAILQEDSNFAIYKGTGPSNSHGNVWNSGRTQSGDHFLILQTDGNLAVYRGDPPYPKESPLWHALRASVPVTWIPHARLLANAWYADGTGVYLRWSEMPVIRRNCYVLEMPSNTHPVRKYALMPDGSIRSQIDSSMCLSLVEKDITPGPGLKRIRVEQSQCKGTAFQTGWAMNTGNGTVTNHMFPKGCMGVYQETTGTGFILPIFLSEDCAGQQKQYKTNRWYWSDRY